MCAFGINILLSKTWSSKFCWFDAKSDTRVLCLVTSKQNPNPTAKQLPTLAFVLPKCQQCFGHFKHKYALASYVVNGVRMCV